MDHSTPGTFFRPRGTRLVFSPVPTVETVGYCQSSLRDEDYRGRVVE